MTRTREPDGQLTVDPVAAVWTSAVAPEVSGASSSPRRTGRFDNDPRSSRFLVLETSPAGPGPELRAPIVMLGTERDRRPGTTGR